jgi:glycosyltransferase involved in cell wall biosynthesis
VMIEAMLVGTPVIAFACGAAPEIVDEGITGFLVHTVEEMVQKISEAARLDRRACRAAARDRWKAENMAQMYVDLYRDTIAHNHARYPRAVSAREGRQIGSSR